MGEEINSSAGENRPFATVDGKYFFFNRSRAASGPEPDDLPEHARPGIGSGDIYWVDAGVIEAMRPTR